MPPPNLRDARLQLLATRSLSRLPLVEAVAAALRGGVDMVQVREKEATDGEVAATVRELLPVVRGAGALILVNDRVAVAVETGADGAHVGPEDLPPEEARRILGPERVLGITTHGLAQARRAAAAGADYVGIGPVFPTGTRRGAVRVIGPEAAGAVAAALALPAFAIGGLTPANARRAVEAGCTRLAVCASILGSPDPEGAARAFLAVLDGKPPPVAIEDVD